MTASGDLGRSQAGLSLGLEGGYGPAPERQPRRQAVAITAFIVIAVVGLYLVKWHPYWLKAHKAAGSHKLGTSILSGTSAASPSGWHAALSFSYHYMLS